MAWISIDKSSGTDSATVVASAPDNYVSETTPVAERTGTITVRANGDVVAPTTIHVRQLGFTPVRPLPDPTILNWLDLQGEMWYNPNPGQGGTIYKYVEVYFTPVISTGAPGKYMDIGAPVLKKFAGSRPEEAPPGDSHDVILQVDREHMDVAGAVPIPTIQVQVYKFTNWDNAEFTPSSLYPPATGTDYTVLSPPSDNVSFREHSGSILLVNVDTPSTLTCALAPYGELTY